MRYDAFISYRHAELDTFVAKSVHKGLETFKVPKSVRKKSGKKKINRVFRDQEELPIGNDLNNNIESALAESEFLIVICSPRTPGSEWVNKEISTFIQMHDRAHVLAVLVEGEPDESFPPLLLTDEFGNNVEPLAADVRGLNKKEVKHKLKTELMRLAAPLLSCSYDDLRQRHRERFVRKVVAIASAVAVLALAFGLYSAHNAMVVNEHYMNSLKNQSKFLADTSIALTKEGDRETATKVAIEALPVNSDRPYVAKAQYALTEALNLYDNGNQIKKYGLLKHEVNVNDFVMNDKSAMLASFDLDGYVYIWELDELSLIRKLPPRETADGEDNEIKGIQFVDDKLYIIDRLGAYAINIDGEILWEIDKDRCITQAWNKDKSLLAICGYHSDENLQPYQTIRIIDVNSGSIVTEIEEKTANSFYYCAFSGDSKEIYTVRDIDVDSKTTVLEAYSINGEKLWDTQIEDSYVSSITVDDKNNIMLVSSSDALFLEVKLTGIKNGKVNWSKDYVADILDACISTEYVSGQKYFWFVQGRSVYQLEAESGKEINKMQAQNSIMDLFYNYKSGAFVLAGEDGDIYFVNENENGLSTNKIFDATFATSKMNIGNGYVCLSYSQCPEILVSNFQPDSTLEEVKNLVEGNSFKGLMVSPGEQNYCIRLSEELVFYETSGNSEISSLTIEEGSFKDGFYLDENTFVACLSNKVVFFDIKECKSETLDVALSDYKISVDKEANIMLLYQNEECYQIDLAKKAIISSGKIDSSAFPEQIKFEYAQLLKGQDKIFFMYSNRFYTADIKTLKPELIENVPTFTSKFREYEEHIVFSEDQRLLAIASDDGYLRIYNFETMELCYENTFYAEHICFVRFSPDCQKIFLQGDDRYLRIFDITSGDMLYISDNADYEYRDMQAYSDCVVLINQEKLFLFNNNLEMFAEVDDGLAYLPKNKKIYSKSTTCIYSCDYRDLNETIEEARRRYGDSEISQELKVKYNIE